MLELIEQTKRSAPTDLPKGTRVLVAEYPGGHVWHTVTQADAVYVSTREVPEGFRRAFIVEVAQ